jgi:roadblock/LC7 domain-containing protein
LLPDGNLLSLRIRKAAYEYKHDGRFMRLKAEIDEDVAAAFRVGLYA